ncbi:hypothetical protein K488DRAFT_46956, partial [Vararia minispora EC-137]
HELRTAPLFTRRAYLTNSLRDEIGQYGLLGETQPVRYGRYINISTNHVRLTRALAVGEQDAPLSAVICGVQGSGKSHTVSIMLESMFVRNCPPIGKLVKPLSGLVFHLGDTGPNAKPCEAAFLSASMVKNAKAPSVRVYVSPGSVQRAGRLYGALCGDLEIEPLVFSEAELDAAAFLSLMAVGSSDSAPLYMQSVLAILRKLGEEFTYKAFMREIDELFDTLNSMQQNSLKQRLELLRTFTSSKLPRSKPLPKPRFAPGQITIVDLSDPFIDTASACGLFEIVLHAFERAEVDTGKVVLVDEAHKYLLPRNSTGLVNALLTVIREQRHRAMRVLISTQEPTVIPPTFLALCPVIIMHRFSSAAWWEHLTKHVAGDTGDQDMIDIVVRLRTGEAAVLAPTGLDVAARSMAASNSGTDMELRKFGRNYILVKTRKRITRDGGVSMLAVARNT